MRRIFVGSRGRCVVGWFSLLLVLVGFAGGVSAEMIPAVHGSTLAGNGVNLPDDLGGRRAVLVIGFSRDAQGAVRDWGRRLAGDYVNSPQVAFYELAMLERVPRLARGFVVRAMKQDVSEGGQAHFLPVVDHEAEWRRVAGYDKAEDAYVLVVDGNGAVRWRTSGGLTEAGYAEVRRQAGGG